MENSGDYDDNSSESVLRVALAVAFSDDMLDHEELAKIEEVYRNILRFLMSVRQVRLFRRT
jgi:tellurite resistance protein